MHFIMEFNFIILLVELWKFKEIRTIKLNFWKGVAPKIKINKIENQSQQQLSNTSAEYFPSNTAANLCIVLFFSSSTPNLYLLQFFHTLKIKIQPTQSLLRLSMPYLLSVNSKIQRSHYINKQYQYFMQKAAIRARLTHPQPRKQLSPIDINSDPHKQTITQLLNTLRHKCNTSESVLVRRKNRSMENASLTGVEQMKDRSHLIKERKARLTLRQQMRVNLHQIQSQIAKLSPQSIVDGLQQDKLSKKSQSANELKLNLFCLPIQQCTDELLRLEKIANLDESTFMFGRPIQMVMQEEQEGRISSTNDLMDHQFNNILQQNLQHKMQFHLQLQSQFSGAKQRIIQQAELLQPNLQLSRACMHQKLLEEENEYIRDQLIQFTEMMDGQKKKMDEYRHKNRMLRKENVRLKEYIQELNQVKSALEKEFIEKEEKYYQMNMRTEEFVKAINRLKLQKGDFQERVEYMQKEYDELDNKFARYQTVKQKQIETLIQDKIREKEILIQEIGQKQKYIDQINEYVQTLKNQIYLLQLQQQSKSNSKHIQSIDNQFQDAIREDSLSKQDVFEEKKSNSICLSLAEAESLKNIIQEKEELHQKEMSTLKEDQEKLLVEANQEKLKLKEKITQYETYIKGLENNQTDLQKMLKNVEIILKTSSSNTILSDSHASIRGLNEQDEAQTQLLKINSFRKVKMLQKILMQQRQQKMKLVGHIRQLQQRCIQDQKQQDEQIQDLLQNCVNELQRQRAINLSLRKQIDNLKKYLDDSGYFGCQKYR